MANFFRRYALLALTIGYTFALVILHLLGLFPRAGLYDISRLIGAPALSFEGTVVNAPMTRWGQTRFLMEGHASPLNAFHGRLLVQTAFPMEELEPGDRVHVRGWLGPMHGPSHKTNFDERTYWAGFRAYAQLHVFSWDAFSVGDTPPGGLARAAWRFHKKFEAFWFDQLPVNEAALISCISIGSRGILPAFIKNQCIRAGVYHILVVSGQKMALLIVLGIVFLRLLRIPRRWAFWLCGPPVIFYALVVGAEPPVLRAATMAIIALAALAMGRDPPGYYPFVLAWFWILLRDPEALFGASFQLSFGATASLLCFLPLWRLPASIRNRWLRWVLEAGSVSLAVHLGIWPLLIYYFHQLSIIGILANWTVFPLSGCVTVLGLLMGSLGVFWPKIVPPIGLRGMHFVLRGLLVTVEWMSHCSWAAVTLQPLSVRATVVYYSLLICILFKIHGRKKTSHPEESRNRL